MASSSVRFSSFGTRVSARARIASMTSDTTVFTMNKGTSTLALDESTSNTVDASANHAAKRSNRGELWPQKRNTKKVCAAIIQESDGAATTHAHESMSREKVCQRRALVARHSSAKNPNTVSCRLLAHSAIDSNAVRPSRAAMNFGAVDCSMMRRL